MDGVNVVQDPERRKRGILALAARKYMARRGKRVGASSESMLRHFEESGDTSWLAGGGEDGQAAAEASDVDPDLFHFMSGGQGQQKRNLNLGKRSTPEEMDGGSAKNVFRELMTGGEQRDPNAGVLSRAWSGVKSGQKAASGAAGRAFGAPQMALWEGSEEAGKDIAEAPGVLGKVGAAAMSGAKLLAKAPGRMLSYATGSDQENEARQEHQKDLRTKHGVGPDGYGAIAWMQEHFTPATFKAMEWMGGGDASHGIRTIVEDPLNVAGGELVEGAKMGAGAMRRLTAKFGEKAAMQVTEEVSRAIAKSSAKKMGRGGREVAVDLFDRWVDRNPHGSQEPRVPLGHRDGVPMAGVRPEEIPMAEMAGEPPMAQMPGREIARQKARALSPNARQFVRERGPGRNRVTSAGGVPSRLEIGQARSRYRGLPSRGEMGPSRPRESFPGMSDHRGRRLPPPVDVVGESGRGFQSAQGRQLGDVMDHGGEAVDQRTLGEVLDQGKPRPKRKAVASRKRDQKMRGRNAMSRKQYERRANEPKPPARGGRDQELGDLMDGGGRDLARRNQSSWENRGPGDRVPVNEPKPSKKSVPQTRARGGRDAELGELMDGGGRDLARRNQSSWENRGIEAPQRVNEPKPSKKQLPQTKAGGADAPKGKKVTTAAGRKPGAIKEIRLAAKNEAKYPHGRLSEVEEPSRVYGSVMEEGLALKRQLASVESDIKGFEKATKSRDLVSRDRLLKQRGHILNRLEEVRAEWRRGGKPAAKKPKGEVGSKKKYPKDEWTKTQEWRRKEGHSTPDEKIGRETPDIPMEDGHEDLGRVPIVKTKEGVKRFPPGSDIPEWERPRLPKEVVKAKRALRQLEERAARSNHPKNWHPQIENAKRVLSDALGRKDEPLLFGGGEDVSDAINSPSMVSVGEDAMFDRRQAKQSGVDMWEDLNAGMKHTKLEPEAVVEASSGVDFKGGKPQARWEPSGEGRQISHGERQVQALAKQVAEGGGRSVEAQLADELVKLYDSSRPDYIRNLWHRIEADLGEEAAARVRGRMENLIKDRARARGRGGPGPL